MPSTEGGDRSKYTCAKWVGRQGKDEGDFLGLVSEQTRQRRCRWLRRGKDGIDKRGGKAERETGSGRSLGDEMAAVKTAEEPRDGTTEGGRNRRPTL